MSEPTREQAEVTPEVTTVPAGSGWSRIPDHLGRARTSTVVLSVLFLAIGTLYLNIRPDTTGTATTGTSSEVPAQVTDPVPTTTTAPEPTVEEPTPTVETTVPGTPTDVTLPEETTRTTVPAPTSTTAEPTVPSAPTSPVG